MRCYLFDIDGTIADLSHRLHHIAGEFDGQGMIKPKDWPAFYAACSDDKPIQHVIDLMLTLHDADQQIIFVSGRSDECRKETLRWMHKLELPDRPIYMRTAGDQDDSTYARTVERVRPE